MFLNWILEINNAKPRTRITLEIFDPITLPTDKFGEFSNTAFIETNNSDREVPKPIIINPTKKSDTPIFFPIEIALDNNTSAPSITK